MTDPDDGNDDDPYTVMRTINGRYTYLVYVDDSPAWPRAEAEAGPAGIPVSAVAEGHHDAPRLLADTDGWVAVPVYVAANLSLFDGMPGEEEDDD